MKKILAIIVLALVAIWLFRPDFSKKDFTPAFTRADVPTLQETISVEDVSLINDEEWMLKAEGLSANYSKNVILTFEEEGGRNESIILTVYNCEDGKQIYEIERERKEVLTSRNKGYGEVQTYREVLKRGEVPTCD